MRLESPPNPVRFTIAVGDVRGIEKNTAKAEKRRFGKDQRRRLSQWSRGRQDHYLAHKTGSKPTYTNESHSSKTCPACLTRNAPSGRDYRCHHCGFTCHRVKELHCVLVAVAFEDLAGGGWRGAWVVIGTHPYPENCGKGAPRSEGGYGFYSAAVISGWHRELPARCSCVHRVRLPGELASRRGTRRQ
ncbi:zinc ribbon domain-containing protein (plasmid) [Pseudarthrobacter sp. P1]|uniref:zinc ribbon domain-containing protein n=1 Tax=Pseudarthrobacter sp. P1 TaxID=3418418 RepID=UPI003CF59615